MVKSRIGNTRASLMILRLPVKVFIAYFFLLPVLCLAQSDDRKCSGFFYRVKRSGVPVYKEPDTASKVLAKLNIGEKVCYTGEENGYAIIMWHGDQSTEPEENLDRAFVRLVELWQPENGPSASRGFFGWLKKFYYYIRSGGVPD